MSRTDCAFILLSTKRIEPSPCIWRNDERRLSDGLGRAHRVADPLRLLRLGAGLVVEHLAHAVRIQRTLPARNDDRGNAIADDIGQGARLRHEAIDAQDQRDAGDRDGSNRGKCGSKHMKPEPVTPAAPFDVKSRMPMMPSCWARLRSVLVACARNSAAIVR